jgi:putative NIF3 family GTP cyclohydrolase 1 type 2
VRVAGADDVLVSTVAVCPGAGGSLFQGVRADLLLTGEMRHHDVLAQVERGGAVILTDHTNTERGFLAIYAERVGRVCGVEVVRSARDHDPLRVRGGGG